MVTCRRVFSAPGWRRSMSPAMMAQVRKVRFIRVASSSHASRSSPSMSSSNSSSRLSRPAAIWRPPDRRAVDREPIVVGHEAERLQLRALQPPGQQHAQGAVREPPLERIGDQIEAARPREGLDQQLAARWDERLQRAAAQAIPPLRRASRRHSSGRRSWPAPARPGRSRAGTCRRHRTGPSGRCPRARVTRRLVADACPRSAGPRPRTRTCRRPPWSRRSTPRSRRARARPR